MVPQDGVLIAAVLVLALAAGCRREDRPAAAAHGDSHRHQVAFPSPAETAEVQEPQPIRTAPPASPPPRPSPEAPAARPGPGQATAELDKLAQDARELRHALLHADFRGVTDKTKEAENDSR